MLLQVIHSNNKIRKLGSCNDIIPYTVDQTSLQALLEVIGSIPQYVTKIYEKESSWIRTLLLSTKSEVRELAAKVYGIITAQLSANDFEKQISEITDILNKKNLEAQHGALLTLTYMMERRLISNKKNTNNTFNLKTYINIVQTICKYVYSCMQYVEILF